MYCVNRGKGGVHVPTGVALDAVSEWGGCPINGSEGGTKVALARRAMGAFCMLCDVRGRHRKFVKLHDNVVYDFTDDVAEPKRFTLKLLGKRVGFFDSVADAMKVVYAMSGTVNAKVTVRDTATRKNVFEGETYEAFRWMQENLPPSERPLTAAQLVDKDNADILAGDTKVRIDLCLLGDRRPPFDAPGFTAPLEKCTMDALASLGPRCPADDISVHTVMFRLPETGLGRTCTGSIVRRRYLALSPVPLKEVPVEWLAPAVAPGGTLVVTVPHVQLGCCEDFCAAAEGELLYVWID